MNTQTITHPRPPQGTGTLNSARDRSLKRLCWITALLLLAGCAGLGTRLSPPRVHIAAIEVGKMQGLETVLRVDLRVMNGNEAVLHLRGIDCELSLNGRKFAAGVSSSNIRIPAFETEIVPVTVYSSVIDLVRGFLDFPKAESLTYRIEGRIRLGGGAVPSIVPFSAEGTLAAEKLHR